MYSYILLNLHRQSYRSLSNCFIEPDIFVSLLYPLWLKIYPNTALIAVVVSRYCRMTPAHYQICLKVLEIASLRGFLSFLSSLKLCQSHAT